MTCRFARVGLLAMLPLLGGCGASQDTATADAPPVDMTGDYSIHTALDLAVVLQSLGRDDAVAALRERAQKNPDDLLTFVMCRMLFQPDGAELRRPGLGAAMFLGGTTYADWPCEPIALRDGVPILVVDGYALAGQAEPAEAYLDYCVEAGTWVSQRYALKTDSEILQAVDQLIDDVEWPQPLSERERAFLRAQAGVPTISD